MLQTILNNIKNNNPKNLDINLATSYAENNGKEIIKILPQIKKPFTIIISCNTFDTDDIKNLVEILPNIQVPFSMNLGGDELQHNVEAILESLTQVTVPFDVDFTCNGIPLSTLKKCKDFLSRMQVSFKMNFAYNEAQNQGMKYITNALPKISVPFELNLKSNEFDNEGAYYIANTLPRIKVPFKLSLKGNDFDSKGAVYIASSMLRAKAPCKITTVTENSDVEFPSIQAASQNNIATMDSKKFFNEIVKKNNLPYILLPFQYEKLFDTLPLEIKEILCSYFGYEHIHNKYLRLIYNKGAVKDNRVETLQYDELIEDLNKEEFSNENTALKPDLEEININENSIKSEYSLQQKIHIIDNSINIARTCIDCYIHEKPLVTNPDLFIYITSLAVIMDRTPATISIALVSQFLYSNNDFSIPLSSIATIMELEITKIISKSLPQMPFQGSVVGYVYILHTTACATLKMLENSYDFITNDLVHLYNHLFFVNENPYSQNTNDNSDSHISYSCDVYGKCTEHTDIVSDWTA